MWVSNVLTCDETDATVLNLGKRANVTICCLSLDLKCKILSLMVDVSSNWILWEMTTLLGS